MAETGLMVTRGNVSAAFEAAVMGGGRHKHSMKEAVSSLPLVMAGSVNNCK